jgi:beta-lysine 5,6-aminomutase alpha subunit
VDERSDALLDRVRDLARDVGATLGAEARASTSVGIERATLRLLGVGGLDREGRPLAAAAVERAIGQDPGRLARGVLLPFAAAVALYEASPGEIALDVAGGAIDLDLEAEALGDPARAREVRAAADALVAAAFSRIEADRTARLDLFDVLGEPTPPLVGFPVRATHVDEARDEVAVLVVGGADVVRIGVPASRELADLVPDPTGIAISEAEARAAREARLAGEPAPAGSQRALSAIRAVVDEAAAERRAYARILAVPPALGAPEAAVVASVERLDIVEADPMAEMADGGVDPARALADHAFLRRVLRRAGCTLVLDAGPLVVGPDFAAGMPASAAVHAGRALALQALSVELARGDGLADTSLLLGSLPAWMLEDRSGGVLALACVAAQRRLFPGIGLALREPTGDGPARDRWRQLRTLALVVAGGAALVTRDADLDTAAAAAVETRTAADLAARIASEAGPVAFGPGFAEAEAAVAASAVATLEALRAEGWDAVLGPAAGGRLAGGTTAARSDAPDVAAIGEARAPAG